MAATDRPVSPLSRRPAARILGAVFAGSAVMFAMTALQDGSPTAVGGGAGSVAGSLPGEAATRPSPEVAAGPQGDSLLTAGDEAAPGAVLLSNETVSGSSSEPADAREASSPDTADGQRQIAEWAPGTTPDWEIPDWEARLQELAARRATTQAASAPATPEQDPPASDDSGQNPPASDEAGEPADQPDHGLLRDLLGHLGAERGH